MKTARNQPTAFRFDSTVKAALSLIAEREGRSMANMLEWLIRRHCEVQGLGWPPSRSEGPGGDMPERRLSATRKTGVAQKVQKGKRDA
jgi:hypothetical protein